MLRLSCSMRRCDSVHVGSGAQGGDSWDHAEHRPERRDAESCESLDQTELSKSDAAVAGGVGGLAPLLLSARRFAFNSRSADRSGIGGGCSSDGRSGRAWVGC